MSRFIPVSFCFFTAYHLVLNSFLVKWMCKAFLGNRVRFQEDLQLANGDANGAVKVKKDTIGDNVVKVLSQGDVAEISHWIMSQANSTTLAVASLLTLWQTKDDVLFNRVSFLMPVMHIGAWYFPVDMYAMFRAYVMRKNLNDLSLKMQVRAFLAKKWSLVLHHIVLFGVGYPVVIYVDSYTKFGHFFIAAFCLQEITNPFISNNFVMKELNLQHTLLYTLNGVVLAILFIVVRVFNAPIVILVYAAQYFNWDVLAAMGSMRYFCHLFNGLVLILNLYWFGFMTRVAVGVLCSRPHRPSVTANGTSKKD